jgi:hypothetical protein
VGKAESEGSERIVGKPYVTGLRQGARHVGGIRSARGKALRTGARTTFGVKLQRRRSTGFPRTAQNLLGFPGVVLFMVDIGMVFQALQVRNHFGGHL